ncbi:P-loop NTPase fold protein [Nocardioides salarius]|uniref:P-loop NTPase fold protein n=1 Tax=Nocardioides salarius TaxID=374513 RepID=UPI0030F8AA8A
MSQRRDQDTSLTAADLVPDTRLDLLAPGESVDRLGHESIAARVAEMLVRVPSSTNVALFAPWGAGKSSFYALLKQAVEQVDGGATVIRYDAWRTSGESFQTHFLASVWDSTAGPGKQPPRSLYNTTKTVHFDPVTALKEHGKLLWWVFAATVAALMILPGLNTAVRYIGENPAAFWPTYFDDLQAWFGKIVTAGVAVAVAIKVVDLAKVSIDEQAPSRSEQFAEIFRDYVDRVRPKPLIVFVDELDRCSPTQMLDVLSGLRTFLETKDCSFVVAVDRAAVNQAIMQDSRQVRPVRAADPYYSTPSEFLDKIFQHQITLPPKRNYTLRTFAGQLVADAGGLWREMREAEDADLYQRVLLTLAPVHVKSPRRVKVLLNSFAMSVRTSQGRGLENWLARADEIAFLSTLRVEFPRFADDLQRVPDLIDLVLDPDRQPRDAVADVVNRWRRPELATPEAAANDLMVSNTQQGSRSDQDGSVPSDEAGGEVRSGSDDPRSPQDRAATALNEQLLSYLRRTVETVAVPRQDLVWMMEKSDASDIADPSLRAALELAVDRETGWVAALFAEESPEVKRAAIRRLANKIYEAPDRFTRDPNLRELALIAAQVTASELAAVAPEALTAIGLCLRQGSRLTPTTAPGVLHLTVGRAGSNTETDAALVAIGTADDPGETAGLAAAGLDTADAAISRARLAAATRPASGRALLQVLESLPTGVLTELAEDAHTTTDLAASVKRPRPPAKPDVTGMAQTAVTAANEEWQQARDQANATAQAHVQWALDLLRTALANEGREDADRDRAVVSMAAEFCASALYNLAVSRQQPAVADLVIGSLDRLLPTARNRLLLILSLRVRSRVKELCDLLMPTVPVPAERALNWGKTMCSQILEETWDPDIARQIIEVAPAIRALADTPGQLDETADEYDRLKPDATWDTETLERHLAAQELLSTFVSDDAMAGTAAAQDVRNAYRQLPDPGPRGRILEWVNAMPIELARRVHALGAMGPEASSAERRDDVLLRLRCEQRAFGEGTVWQDDAESPVAVSADEILSLDEDDQSEEVVDAWIRIQSDWADGGSVYRDAASWPSERSTAVYAAHMSTSDRTRCFVWTANHEKGPERLLRVLGKDGIETTELSEVWVRARNGESSHNERKRDVSKVLCLNPQVPGVLDLWMQVFDALETLHRGVDLNVAAELALQIGAALTGHDNRREHLASRLQSWIDDQPNSHLLAGTRDDLIDAGLLPKPPSKGLLSKIANQFQGD